MDVEPQTFSGRKGEIYTWHPDRRLGRGRFGEVFEAETVDGLPHVVKRVYLSSDTTSRWYADARLAVRELDVAKRLGRSTTENVMPVVDDLLMDDSLLIVMPRADHSLHDLLSGGRRLDESETRALLLDLAHALTFLAHHAVVHRDIKPSNVLWWQNRWVLADLGTARILDLDTGTYTWAGTGTHAYWAPELFTFEPANVATDLYALGCVAVAALTGQPPFTTDDLARAHRLDAPDIPAMGDIALERTIRRLLFKEPGGRPTDARMVQQLLEPVGANAPDQQSLLRAASRTARRNDEKQRRVNVERERSSQGRDALATLETIVEDTVTRARQILPQASGLRQGDTWFINVAEAAARITIQIVEPSAPVDELWMGVVSVAFLDAMEKSVVANLLCRYQDGRAMWEIVKFEQNDIAAERQPIGPRRAPGGAGLGLQYLNGVLPELNRRGAPPVLMQTATLTPQTLLTELVAELDEDPS